MPRAALKKNAIRVLDSSSHRIQLSHIYLVLRTLGLKIPDWIVDFDVALQCLHRVSYFSEADSLQDIRPALESFFEADKIDHFLNHFPRSGVSHKSGKFRLTDEEFLKNPIYGLFAGIENEIYDRFTLNLNQHTQTYHPLLTFGLISVIFINKTTLIDEEYKGMKTLCNNLKRLVSIQSWKDNFSKLIIDFINQSPNRNDLSLPSFFTAVTNKELNLASLDKDQESLLRKLVNIFDSDGDSILHPSNDMAEELQNKLPAEPEEKMGDNAEILIKPKIDIDIDEDLEKQSNLFIKTVGTHRKERDAQNLLYSNETLLPNEIATVEESIYQTDIDNRLRLCRALSLYYSIPIERIPSILIGIPELDFTKEVMRARIVIDTENNKIYLPTPIQVLHEESDEKLKHQHLPLILESNTKTFIELVANKKMGGSLADFLDKDLINLAKSFKDLPEFRQHRITRGKVAQALSTNILNYCHDQVKTAYLQGGSYKFIHMGCYYTRLSIQSLNELFLVVSKSTFKRSEFPEHAKEQGFIGSQRTPEIDAVKSFLIQTRKKLENLKHSIKITNDLWTFHNEFTLYTITLLNLSTTHRPHLDPYFTQQNFIDDKLVQITEKVVMKGFEGRVCVLSDQSVQQYHLYLKHLACLAEALLKQGFGELSQVLTNLLEGLNDPKDGLPLFFLIKNSKIQPINKSSLKTYYQSIEGLEFHENFYRHCFSSYMTSIQIPRLLIATQMGHISKGLEPFSASTQLSPVEFYKKLKPSLNKYFSVLGIVPVKPPILTKYKKLSLTNLTWETRSLGPFHRETARKFELEDDTITVIDQILWTSESNSLEKRIYINKALQSNHLKMIKKMGFRKAQKTLSEYYHYKKTKFSWKIESYNPLVKSPFDRFFGFKFQQGKKYYNKILSTLLEFIENKDLVDSKNTQIMLSLSALVSGAVFNKTHLLEIAKADKKRYQDIGISLAIDLTGLNIKSCRTWILNSVSVSIVNKLNDNCTAISEMDIDAYLKTLGMPRLSKLTTYLKCYHRIYFSGIHVNFIDNLEMQNSVGVAGYQAMFGNFTPQNNALSTLYDSHHDLSLAVEGAIAKEKQSNIDENLSRMKTFSSLLGDAKRKGLGWVESLTEIEQFESNLKEYKLLLVEHLLINWIKHELDIKALAVSSITTYFSKIYGYVIIGFKEFSSIEEIEDDNLYDDIYPQILKSISEDYDLKNTVGPFSALGAFHTYLSEFYGFQDLHFSSGKVEKKSSIQPLLHEQQYQQILKFIDETPDCDKKTKSCLKLGFILYKKMGLRLGEIFKLQPKNICLESKTIHVSGNRISASKSERGNRLLTYDLLLDDKEMKLLSTWSENLTLHPKVKYFLFDDLNQKYSNDIVLNRISHFYKTLIRSVTNNPKLSIKSLRKSFASEVFIKLSTHKNNRMVRSLYKIKDSSIQDHIHKVFNLSTPENLYWLEADWMGHSTPLTSFESYVLTKDLAVFLHSEVQLESLPNYLKILRSLAPKQDFNEAVFRNLNRYQNEKFLRLFATKLTNLKKVPFQGFKPSFKTLFNVKLDIDTLQKALVLNAHDIDPFKIDQYLYMPDGTTNLIKGMATNVTQQEGNAVPATIIKNMIKKLSWFEFDGGTFNKKRLSKATYQTLSNALEILSVKEINIMADIWKRQIPSAYEKTAEFTITSRQDLKLFLSLYKKIHAHNTHGGYLSISAKGIKNLQEDPCLDVEEAFIMFSDDRQLDGEKFPVEEFILKVSNHAKTAKVKEFCSYGLNSIIFWAFIAKQIKE